MGSVGKQKPAGRSLITYLEWRAENTPDLPCIQQPNHDFSKIASYSYKQVSQIVDNLAAWLVDKLGEYEPLSTLAFFGAPDPRYVFVTLAAKKADCLALYLGLQNSFEANSHLCKETRARAVLHVDGIDPSVLPQDEDLQRICIPEIDQLLELESHAKLPEVNHESGSFLCLHSSGSTGMPKPIYIASECLSITLNRLEALDFDGFPVRDKSFLGPSLLYFGIPIYHMSGFIVGTRYALYYGIPVLYMPRDRKPGVDLFLETLNKTQVDAALVTPGVLDELAEREDSFDKLERLKHIESGGGILPHDACEKLNKIVRIQAVFGSTEITDFAPVVHEKPREDWEYFHISPEHNSIEWREGPDGDFHELVIKREPSISHLQGVFYNFPDKDEFATGDLFSQHPKKKNFWKYESRADDQISFKNASTLNPLPIEEKLQEDENIQHAMLVGEGRPFPILVIQPTEEALSQVGSYDELRDKLWTTVSEVNKSSRANGQIASQRHVLLTDKDKPLSKTAKMTVSKKASVKLYADEIDGIYNNATEDDYRDLSKRIDE